MFETQTIPEAHSIVLLKRIFKIVVSAYLVIGMISAYRAFYQVKSLELQSSDVLQSGSRITTNVVSYARGAVEVRIDLVQGDHSAMIGFQRVHGNEWALFDPRTQHGSQTVVLTSDMLNQFTAGEAVVRATATGRPQWGRLPPPLVREAVVNIADPLAAQTPQRCQPPPPMPKNPKPGVIGLSLTRDGKTLIAAGGDSIIRVWDVASGQLQRTLTGHTNAVYKANLSPNEKLIASSSRDLTARIWDFATGRELHRLTGFHCAVKSIAFSPDSKTVAAVGNDGMVKIWDVSSGNELKTLVHTDSHDVDNSTYSVVFSRNGKEIYAGNGDGTVSEWDIASGKEKSVWKAHRDTVYDVVFTPDYRLLATDGYNEALIKLWDFASRRELRTFGEKKTEGLFENSHVLAISPNGKMIATSVMGIDEKQQKYVYVRTFVWNLQTGEKLFTFEGQKFDVGGLVFTPDNRYLISGSVDMTIKFYDLKTGKEARTLTQPIASATN